MLQDLKQEIQDKVNSVGEETVAYIIYLLKQEDKVATGRLLKSFSYKTIEKAEEILLTIESDTDYSFYIDEGRKAGKFPNVSKIEQWTKQKGLRGRDKKGKFIPQKSLAFLIARSIYKFGIKPTKFSLKASQYAERRLLEELSQLKSLEDIFDTNITIKS